MVNYVNKPTRICTRNYKSSNEVRTSETLIDLFLHNSDLVDETNSIECPFSDHNFVIAKLSIKKQSAVRKKVICRNLCLENLTKIYSLVDSIELSELKNLKTIEEKWCYIRDRFLSIVDEIAPLREICVNVSNQFPWYDDDLIIVKHSRDSAYKKFKRSLQDADKEIFEYFKRQFKQMSNFDSKFQALNFFQIKNRPHIRD